MNGHNLRLEFLFSSKKSVGIPSRALLLLTHSLTHSHLLRTLHTSALVTQGSYFRPHPSFRPETHSPQRSPAGVSHRQLQGHRHRRKLVFSCRPAPPLYPFTCEWDPNIAHYWKQLRWAPSLNPDITPWSFRFDLLEFSEYQLLPNATARGPGPSHQTRIAITQQPLAALAASPPDMLFSVASMKPLIQ